MDAEGAREAGERQGWCESKRSVPNSITPTHKKTGKSAGFFVGALTEKNQVASSALRTLASFTHNTNTDMAVSSSSSGGKLGAMRMLVFSGSLP